MNNRALEHDLRTYRPAGYEHLPEDFVWPRYEGFSVGNIPATVARLLGARPRRLLPPLRADLLDGLTDGVRRIVLLLVDGLGWERMNSRLQLRNPPTRITFQSPKGDFAAVARGFRRPMVY